MADRGKIAIVDDDAAVRDSTCLLLAVVGHSAVAYASALEFLDGCEMDDVPERVC